MHRLSTVYKQKKGPKLFKTNVLVDFDVREQQGMYFFSEEKLICLCACSILYLCFITW